MVDRAFRWVPLVLVSLLLVWVTREAAQPLRDPDVWWHLRLGNDLIEQRSFAPPQWSTFADRSWVPTQPLTEVVMATVERWFGLSGVAWLFGLGLLALVLSLYAAARVRGDRLAAAVAVVLAMLGCSVALSPRPQLVSLVLLPIVVAAWLRTADDGRPRWWLIAVLGVWSVCHGFWFVGIGVSAVSALAVAVDRRVGGRGALRLVAIPAVSLALVAILPRGREVLAAPFRVNATAHFISEWRATEWLSPAALAVESMMLVVVVTWVLRRRRPSILEVALLLMAVALLWYSQRTVALASVLMVPALAGALQEWVDPDPDPALGRQVGRPSRRERLTLAAVGIACLAVLAAVVPGTASHPANVPAGLDPALAALPPSTPVLNGYDIGGWLAWQHPDLDRYVDGLTDAYSSAHLERYGNLIEAGPGWQQELQAAHLDTAVIPASSPLATALEGAAGP